MTITNHTAKGIDDRIEALTAGLPQNIVRVLVRTITADQIKALKNSPVELIPSPGDGNLIILNSVVFRYIYGTAVFTEGNDGGQPTVPNIYYGVPANGLQILTFPEASIVNDLFTFPANQHGWVQPADGALLALGDDSHSQIGSNIMLGLLCRAGETVDYTDGDGTLILTLLHSIVPVA